MNLEKSLVAVLVGTRRLHRPGLQDIDMGRLVALTIKMFVPDESLPLAKRGEFAHVGVVQVSFEINSIAEFKMGHLFRRS